MSETRSLCFLTVLGHDRKGIVASVSSLLYEADVNIEDISQKIMQGYFVMAMLIDVTESPLSLEELKAKLAELEAELGLRIQLQHEEIFSAMHRI